MKILFIGGTKFVGRQMVEDALLFGYEVSIIQRGQTNCELFPQAKKYFGDRWEIHAILPPNEYYDVVVDTCGYHPEVVQQSVQALHGRVGLYIFISTISVYRDFFSGSGLNEKSDLISLAEIPSRNEKVTFVNYGGLKVLCEETVLKTMGEKNSLILRPTIIVGRYDETQRFNYWLEAMLNQNELDVPDDTQAPIQFIDVRALSNFTLNSALKNRPGVFNIVGPKKSMRFIEFLEAARKLLNPHIKFQSISASKILDENLFSKFPMYNSPSTYGAFQVDASKAYEVGLMEINFEDTISYAVGKSKVAL